MGQEQSTTTPGHGTAGLIPSPQFQQVSHQNFSLASQGSQKGPEPLEIHTYEEVVRAPSFKRKCLVLIGAYGVGRRHIKSSLIEQIPDHFSYPIPYTSRNKRNNEK